MLANSVFCSSGYKVAKDTLVRKGIMELSKVTTVFIYHRDATCDLFQQDDKEGRKSPLAEETQYSGKCLMLLVSKQTVQFQELRN